MCLLLDLEVSMKTLTRETPVKGIMGATTVARV
jgi:hypothetical protein